MFTKIKNQRGFVFVEFVIALPLTVLLIYALAQMIIQISDLGKRQAAEYVLENEAHEILEQITRDARAASYVKVRQAVGISGQEPMYEIFFYYRTLNNSPRLTTNLLVPHRYTVGAGGGHGYQIYAERLQDGPKVNPISGGNFLANTTVTKLKFSQPSEKVLHITLELQSVETDRKFKLNTSVFMPACEEIEGIYHE